MEILLILISAKIRPLRRKNARKVRPHFLYPFGNPSYIAKLPIENLLVGTQIFYALFTEKGQTE